MEQMCFIERFKYSTVENVEGKTVTILQHNDEKYGDHIMINSLIVKIYHCIFFFLSLTSLPTPS